MKRSPQMEEAEQLIVAAHLAVIGRLLADRAPPRIIRQLAKMVALLKLPSLSRATRQWLSLDHKFDPMRETPRRPERLSEDEINIVMEWLPAIELIYNSKVSCLAIDASSKLSNDLYSLLHMPIKTKGWWRSDRLQ